MPRGRKKQYDFHGLSDKNLDFLSPIFAIIRHTLRTIPGEFDEDKTQILAEIQALAELYKTKYTANMDKYCREFLSKY